MLITILIFMSHKENRTLIPMGDSLGITLPFSWLNYHNSKPGDKVEIITHGKTAEVRLLKDNGCEGGEGGGENIK